jgi:histidinol-phosphate aminotransferase
VPRCRCRANDGSNTLLRLFNEDVSAVQCVQVEIDSVDLCVSISENSIFHCATGVGEGQLKRYDYAFCDFVEPESWQAVLNVEECQETVTAMQRAKNYIMPLPIRARAVRPQPKGLPIVDLSFNELPWGPTATVQSAIDKASAAANRYGNPSCEDLRRTIAECWSLNAEQIICGNGSEELLDVIGRVFARDGDEILISEFGYIQFPIVANRVGATLVKAPETEYTTSVDALLNHVSARTTVVFLANPNNPTGTMIAESELRRLASSIPATSVLVIDLAYGEFAGERYCASLHKLVSEFDNVIITQTFSKAYGLAGLRIGWLYAPEWMIPSLYAARGMGTANALAQAAAAASLTELSSMRDRVDVIVAERDRVSTQLISMGVQVVPSSANFLMISPESVYDGSSSLSSGDKTSHHSDAPSYCADALATHLYDEAGFLVNRTREAGLEKFIRFSFSLPDHNDRLLTSFAEFVENC